MAIVWADFRSQTNMDVYFTLSSDNGATWLPAKAIASQPTDEFMPSITIDDNHLQQVVYYRRMSTDPSIKTFNAFIISSANGTGNFSAPTQLNDGGNISPVQFGGTFIGDYIGMDATTVRQPAWMDSRRGQQDSYTTTVSGC
jgi:hypothetical protein